MRGLKFLLLLLLLLFVISLPLAMTFRHGRTGSIEGLVLDESGSPVAQASVQASDVDRGALSGALSTPGGEFRIVGVPSGRYSLWIQAPGFRPQWLGAVAVARGEVTRRNVHLKREPPAPVETPDAN